ncbi:MAG TPA: hypothetical protein VMN76_11475 [Acidobacteriota bacterium]|nr:hypothetical protein [Acidobacteriota bacterium]
MTTGHRIRSWAFIFKDLERGASFSPDIHGDGDCPAFQEEMAFIGEEIDEAVRQIRQVLFDSSENTVSVGQLRRGNMLILLDRVQTMSRELEKRLPGGWRRVTA